jgi:hypothetical protein
MEVDGDFANFRAVYDELTDEVGRARYTFLPDHIENWLRTLDTTPRVSETIKRLEQSVNYREWRDALTRNVAAQTNFNWPKDQEQALGIKLSLFRSFRRPDDIANFGYSFIRSHQDTNANAREVIDQIFMPMARELRRYLQLELATARAAVAANDPDKDKAQPLSIPTPNRPPLSWVPDPVWDMPHRQRNNALLDSPSNFVPTPIESSLPPIEVRFETLQARVALLEAGLEAHRRDDRQIGPGHNQGPAFTPVEDLSEVDDWLIALLKEKGPRPPPDPTSLIEQGEKALRISERISNAAVTLGAEMAKGGAREAGKELLEWIGIGQLIKDLFLAIIDWLKG